MTTALRRGSASYRAPEVLLHSVYSKKVDIWALGCILYELASRKIAFKGDLETINSRLTIQISVPRLPVTLGNHLQMMLNELLHKDAQQRPTVLDSKLLFRFYCFILNPTVTQDIGELKYLPSYAACRNLVLTCSDPKDFLKRLAGLFKDVSLSLCDVSNTSGETPLHWAAAKGADSVVQTLIKAKFFVHALGRSKQTALHWAARSGNSKALKLLLEAQCVVNAMDSQNRTPLHWAAGEGHIEIVDMLLRAGTDARICDSSALTALHWAAYGGHNSVVVKLLDAGIHPDIYRSPSPLLLAAERGHIEVVRTLLLRGSSHSSRNVGGETALYWAAVRGWKEIVKLLLAAGADPLVSDHSGNSPFEWAVTLGHWNIARTMLSTTLDCPLARGRYRNSPLFFACWSPLCVKSVLAAYTISANSIQPLKFLHHAVMDEDYESLETLLKAGARDTCVQVWFGDSALHWAAALGNIDITRLLLSHSNEYVSVRNNCDESPLDMAAAAGHNDVVKLLLNAGADISARDKHGKTALHRAVWSCHSEVVDSLIAAGVDVSATTYSGATALHRAAWQGQKDVVVSLLKSGANLDARYFQGGDTPFLRSIRSGDPNIIQLFLNSNADISVRGSHGANALHIAAHHGMLEVMKLLLASNIDVSCRTHAGETPLHWAVEKGNYRNYHVYFPNPRGSNAIVQLLLAAGSDVSAKTGRGQTPLDLATETGDMSVIQTLIQASLTASATKTDGTSLHQAVAEGNYDRAFWLAYEGNIDVLDINSDGETVLHLAAKLGDDKMVRMLLDAISCLSQLKAVAIETFGEVSILRDSVR